MKFHLLPFRFSTVCAFRNLSPEHITPFSSGSTNMKKTTVQMIHARKNLIFYKFKRENFIYWNWRLAWKLVWHWKGTTTESRVFMTNISEALKSASLGGTLNSRPGICFISVPCSSARAFIVSERRGRKRGDIWRWCRKSFEQLESRKMEKALIKNTRWQEDSKTFGKPKAVDKTFALPQTYQKNQD